MRRKSSIKPSDRRESRCDRTPLKSLASATKENIRRKKEEEYARLIEEERIQQQANFHEMVLKADDPFARRKTLAHTPPAPSSILKLSMITCQSNKENGENNAPKSGSKTVKVRKTPNSNRRSPQAATRLSMGADDTMEITVALNDTTVLESDEAETENIGTLFPSEQEANEFGAPAVVESEPIPTEPAAQTAPEAHVEEEHVLDESTIEAASLGAIAQCEPQHADSVPDSPAPPTPIESTQPTSPAINIPLIVEAYAVAEVVGRCEHSIASFGASGAYAYAQEIEEQEQDLSLPASAPIPYDEIPVGSNAHRRHQDRLSIEEVLQAFREDPVATETALAKASISGCLMPADFRKFVKAFRSPPRNQQASDVCVNPLSLHQIVGSNTLTLANAVNDVLAASHFSRSIRGTAGAAASSPRSQLLDMLERADSPSSSSHAAGFATKHALGRTPSKIEEATGRAEPPAPAPTPASDYKPVVPVLFVPQDDAIMEEGKDGDSVIVDIPIIHNEDCSLETDGSSPGPRLSLLNTSLKEAPLSVGKWTARELSQAETVLRRVSRGGKGDSTLLQPLQEEIERLRIEMARQREHFENVVAERSLLISRLETVETRISTAAVEQAAQAMKKLEEERVQAGIASARQSLKRLGNVQEEISQRRAARIVRMAAMDKEVQQHVQKNRIGLPSPGQVVFKKPSINELAGSTSAFYRPVPVKTFASTSFNPNAFMPSAAAHNDFSDHEDNDQGFPDYDGGYDNCDDDGYEIRDINHAHNDPVKAAQKAKTEKNVARRERDKYSTKTHSFKAVERGEPKREKETKAVAKKPNAKKPKAYAGLVNEEEEGEASLEAIASRYAGGNLRFVSLLSRKVVPEPIEIDDWTEDEGGSKSPLPAKKEKKVKVKTIMEKSGRKRSTVSEAGKQKVKKSAGVKTEKVTKIASNSKDRKEKEKKKTVKAKKCVVRVEEVAEAELTMEIDLDATIPIAENDADDDTQSSRPAPKRRRSSASAAQQSKHTPYQVYAIDARPAVKALYPEAPSSAVTKIIADDWKNLSAADKAHWTMLAKGATLLAKSVVADEDVSFQFIPMPCADPVEVAEDVTFAKPESAGSPVSFGGVHIPAVEPVQAEVVETTKVRGRGKKAKKTITPAEVPARVEVEPTSVEAIDDKIEEQEQEQEQEEDEEDVFAPKKRGKSARHTKKGAEGRKSVKPAKKSTKRKSELIAPEMEALMSGSSSDAQADAVLVPEAEKAATVADIIVQPPAKTRKVEKEVAPKVLAPKNNQKNLAGVVNINLPIRSSVISGSQWLKLVKK